jgi:alpha-tubulin suppressor-like RCC1 family protein
MIGGVALFLASTLAIGTIGVTAFSAATQAKRTASYDTLALAVESRAQQYAAALDSSLSAPIVPSSGRECATNGSVCTTVLSDPLAGDGTKRTLRIQADDADTRLTMTRDVQLQATVATHVTAISSDGRPTWAAAEEGLVFTIWGVAGGTVSKVTASQMSGPAAGTRWVDASPRNGIDSAGRAWVYGANNVCQAGTGSTSVGVAATVLTAPQDVRDASASADSAFFLDASGTAWGYGANAYGQLGVGNTTVACTPTAIKGIKFIAVTTANGSSFGIDINHHLWAWGVGGAGQLGDGKKASYLVPTQIATSTKFVAVATNGSSSWAIAEQGRLWSWGKNSSGQLGNGTTADTTAAAQLSSSTVFTRVAAGAASVYAIEKTGQLWAAGENSGGELGDTTTTDRPNLTRVGAGKTIVDITAGRSRAFALDSSGHLWGWGEASSGRLGIGWDTTVVKTLTPVNSSTTYRSISGGPDLDTAAAVDTDGNLWAIGTGGSGLWNASLNTNPLTPTRMPRPAGFTAPTWK